MMLVTVSLVVLRKEEPTEIVSEDTYRSGRGRHLQFPTTLKTVIKLEPLTSE